MVHFTPAATERILLKPRDKLSTNLNWSNQQFVGKPETTVGFDSFNQPTQISHKKKLTFRVYWLLNRDPYNL